MAIEDYNRYGSEGIAFYFGAGIEVGKRRVFRRLNETD